MITTLVICIAISAVLGIGYGVGRIDSIRIQKELDALKDEKMREATYQLIKGFVASFERKPDKSPEPTLPLKRKRGRPRKNPLF